MVQPLHDLESYHYAWLAAHPERTEGWLREKMAEGFSVHHMDGNHANDAPGNLVLIDSVDHMRLHGMRALNPVRPKGSRGPRKPHRDTMLKRIAALEQQVADQQSHVARPIAPMVHGNKSDGLVWTWPGINR